MTPTLDRLPPHSTEAEQAALGCILLSGDCLGEMAEKTKHGSELFYDIRHQVLFSCLLEMQEEQIQIDIFSVQQRLKDKQQLDGIGGLAYLASLPDGTPSAANFGYYLTIVLEKFALRQILAAATHASTQVYNFDAGVETVTDLVDRTERDIHAILEQGGRNEKGVRELVNESINQIETFHKNKGKITGVPTGFPDLDHLTWGLQSSDMIVIAARPSMGKTTLAMQIAERTAVEDKNHVGVFSLEMSGKQLITRSLCSRARVNIRSVQEGFLAERDFPKLTGAAGRISASNLHINDESGLSIGAIRSKARRWHSQHGIKLLVIDYLQLITTSKRCDKREGEIADISSGVKGIAKELDIPVIIICQLNREIERRGGRPKMSDLRESGAIEQDADIVAMLWQPTAEETDGKPKMNVPTNLFIAKHRNGPSGLDVELLFDKEHTRFESAAKIQHEPEEQWSQQNDD